jgi:hypothetical protein
MKDVLQSTDVAEIVQAYSDAVRNLDPTAISVVEREPLSSVDDPHTLYCKKLYARLVELGHGVIDLRPPRPEAVFYRA